MRIRIIILITLGVLSLGTMLTACDYASPSRDVIHAEAVDELWGYEEMRSGAVRAWLAHDDLAGYCTGDPELIKRIKEYNGERVRLTFRRQKWSDEESPGFFSTTGCTSLYTGGGTIIIFKIVDIELWESSER